MHALGPLSAAFNLPKPSLSARTGDRRFPHTAQSECYAATVQETVGKALGLCVCDSVSFLDVPRAIHSRRYVHAWCIRIWLKQDRVISPTDVYFVLHLIKGVCQVIMGLAALISRYLYNLCSYIEIFQLCSQFLL